LRRARQILYSRVIMSFPLQAIALPVLASALLAGLLLRVRAR
jgi:hypothetical protein